MRPDAMKRIMNQAFELVQKQYAEQQKAEAAELHNRIVQVIEDVKPSSENLLLVLELLRQEALGNLINRFSEIKAAPPVEETGKEA